MKRTCLLLLASLLFVGCGNTPGNRSYQLANGQADLSPQCRTISIDSPAGHYTLTAAQTDLPAVEAALPATITARCLDASGATTGQTTLKVSGLKVTLQSSENSALRGSYAQNHDTQGIFPIVLE